MEAKLKVNSWLFGKLKSFKNILVSKMNDHQLQNG
jgi:hypothetical protein